MWKKEKCASTMIKKHIKAKVKQPRLTSSETRDSPFDIPVAVPLASPLAGKSLLKGSLLNKSSP